MGYWRFQDGAGATVSDSSGGGHHATFSNLGWETYAKFGSAGVFDGSNTLGNAGSSPDFNQNHFSIEAWIKLHAYGSEYMVLRTAPEINGKAFEFYIADNSLALAMNNPPHGATRLISTDDLLIGRWYHAAATYDGSVVRLYLNGVLIASQDYTAGVATGGGDLFIGGPPTATELFNGEMQHLRMSNMARVPDPYGQFGNILTEPTASVGSAIPYLGEPPGPSDLAVVDLVVYPADSSLGGGIVVQATMLNQSENPTHNSFAADLYSGSQPIGSGDLDDSIWNWMNAPIAPGAAVTFTTVITSLAGEQGRATVQEMPHEMTATLFFQADSTGVVHETDEDNNISAGMEVCIASPDAFEGDDAPESASLVPLVETQTHNFDGLADQDWVKFNAYAGDIYIIRAFDLSSSADTYLYLYDSDGATLLAANDDYGSSLGSRIEWVAPATGTYYVMVRHWNPNVTGCGTTYSLQVVGIAITDPLENRCYLPMIAGD